MALTERIGSRIQISALNAAAREAGLEAGLPLADARSRMAKLDARPMDRPADAALLSFLARACLRYSPSIALNGDDALTLDITGCAHLFGGEAAMMQTVSDDLHRRGLATRIAIAGTAEAAHAMARFGQGGIAAPGADEEAVANLPVASLQMDPAVTARLTHLGLKTIAALVQRPRAPLAARFGTRLTDRLDRLRGRTDIPPANLPLMPPCWAEQRFPEPVLREEEMLHALERLIEATAAEMERRGEGGRHFECLVFRTDGIVRSIETETSAPTRAPEAILRLFRERFAIAHDALDPGFGFDLIRLIVGRTEPLATEQFVLEKAPGAAGDVNALADRLHARLGRTNVLRLRVRDTHAPERAAKFVPVMSGLTPPHPLPPLPPCEPPLRPLTLFQPPQRIEVLAARMPDGPPARLRWQHNTLDVVRAEGPERIAPEWWRHLGDDSAPVARDYFRIEDTTGRRLWIYSQDTPRIWFIHGLLP